MSHTKAIFLKLCSGSLVHIWFIYSTHPSRGRTQQKDYDKCALVWVWVFERAVENSNALVVQISYTVLV